MALPISYIWATNIRPLQAPPVKLGIWAFLQTVTYLTLQTSVLMNGAMFNLNAMFPMLSRLVLLQDSTLATKSVDLMKKWVTKMTMSQPPISGQP